MGRPMTIIIVPQAAISSYPNLFIMIPQNALAQWPQLYGLMDAVNTWLDTHNDLEGFSWVAAGYVVYQAFDHCDFYHKPDDAAPYKEVNVTWPMKVWERTGPPTDFVKVYNNPDIWIPASQVTWTRPADLKA
jgi:hypothetical protein